MPSRRERSELNWRPWSAVAAKFVLLLGLLLAPWPHLDQLFTSGFCVVGNALGARADYGHSIVSRLEVQHGGELPSNRANLSWHALYCLENTETHAVTRLGFNTRVCVYIPLAAYLSLIFALNIWKRPRAWLALLVGALPVLAWITTAFTLFAWQFLVQKRVIESTQDSMNLLTSVLESLIVPPGMIYVVPMLGAGVAVLISRSSGDDAASSAKSLVIKPGES